MKEHWILGYARQGWEPDRITNLYVGGINSLLDNKELITPEIVNEMTELRKAYSEAIEIAYEIQLKELAKEI
jgi:hypothetical protein